MLKEIEVFFIQNGQGDLKCPYSTPVATNNSLCLFDRKRRENRESRFFQFLHQNSLFGHLRNDYGSFPCGRSSRIQDPTTFSHLIEVAFCRSNFVSDFLNLDVCSILTLLHGFTSPFLDEFCLSRYFRERVFDDGV